MGRQSNFDSDVGYNYLNLKELAFFTNKINFFFIISLSINITIKQYVHTHTHIIYTVL